MNRFFLGGVAALVAASSFACTTYPLARDVKLVSFEDEITPGKSVGPIEGDDCVWFVLGYPLGGAPTLDRAMANARLQRKSEMLDTFSKGKGDSGAGVIRYMNNVSTASEGFNAYIIGKQCLVVKGTGYRS